MQPSPAQRLSGVSILVFAIAFNIPYAVLAVLFDYPGVLRLLAGDVLNRFAEGGARLVLAWYGFALAALAFAPISVMLAITRHRLTVHPQLAIAAAMIGTSAAVTQSVGLSRWVFVVPWLAGVHANAGTSPTARLAAEQSFDVLNAYGGVAIGENLGQLLTAMFVVLVAMFQFTERNRATAALGIITALVMTIGTGQGLAIALGKSTHPYASFTIAGFLGLTLWLIATGLIMARRPAP